jgi:hypothetical protein
MECEIEQTRKALGLYALTEQRSRIGCAPSGSQARDLTFDER